MSTHFILILLLPLLPIAIGGLMLIYFRRSNRLSVSSASGPFGKIFGWGFLAVIVFVIFVIVSTIIYDSPQGPLMLLFSSVPFTIGAFIGLGIWIVKTTRNKKAT